MKTGMRTGIRRVAGLLTTCGICLLLLAAALALREGWAAAESAKQLENTALALQALMPERYSAEVTAGLPALPVLQCPDGDYAGLIAFAGCLTEQESGGELPLKAATEAGHRVPVILREEAETGLLAVCMDEIPLCMGQLLQMDEGEAITLSSLTGAGYRYEIRRRTACADPQALLAGWTEAGPALLVFLRGSRDRDFTVYICTLGETR